MSKIDELIQQYCPDGVEWVKFVDYAFVQYGCPFDATKFTDDNSFIPLIRIRDVLSGKAGTYYTGDFSNDYIITKGDILVGMDGNFNLGIWNDIDGLLNQRVCKLYTKDDSKLLNGFIKHYLKPVFRRIEESTAGGSVKHLSAKTINSIEIPLPPIQIQEEIVKILDTFSELQAELLTELNEELQARTQQYQYYRDKLFAFDGRNDIVWKKLGDIASVTKLAGFEFTNFVKYADNGKIIALRGLNVKNGHLDLSDVKYIDGSDFTKLSRSKLRISDLLFTYVGTVGQVAIVDKNDAYYLAPNVAMIRVVNDGLIPKFLMYYFFTGIFWDKQMMKLLQNSSMKNIPMEKIRKFDIPIPSVDEQKRIISVLDKFDIQINDISQSLSSEMEARKQQYEYYRDKLLTFKRKGA